MTCPTEPLLYSTLGDDPEMGELVEMFVGDLPDRIQAIQSAMTAIDLEEIGRLAHQMKGAAGGYGFDQLTAVALGVEQAARGGDPAAQVLAQAATFVDALQRVRPGTP